GTRGALWAAAGCAGGARTPNRLSLEAGVVRVRWRLADPGAGAGAVVLGDERDPSSSRRWRQGGHALCAATYPWHRQPQLWGAMHGSMPTSMFVQSHAAAAAP